MRVAFVTFGCRLNRAEALDLEARYAAAGHTIVPLPGNVPLSRETVPDLIVVRGCSVTAKAQRDCEKAIARLRERFPESRIVVTGCLPGAERAELPPPTPEPAVNLSTSRAYLKIQDGCSGKCAFCIVPRFRGAPRSVPFDEVLAQARAFLAAGFRELVVTGCNLALYRDSGHGLPDLLAALANLTLDDSRSRGTRDPTMGTIPPCSQEFGRAGAPRTPRVALGRAGAPRTPSHHRVRLGSLEPGICDEKLLEVFAQNANICRFIHLSVQSGSNRVLKLMNRPYSVEKVETFCARAYDRLGPRLALGADLITGFPGETDDDFAQTLSLAAGQDRSFRFVNLHVFPYSERPGTPAATMPNAVPRAIRLARARELETIGRENRRRFATTFLGETVEACVEKDGNGWTSEYLHAKLPPGFPRRQLVRSSVSSVDEDTLILGTGN